MWSSGDADFGQSFQEGRNVCLLDVVFVFLLCPKISVERLARRCVQEPSYENAVQEDRQIGTESAP